MPHHLPWLDAKLDQLDRDGLRRRRRRFTPLPDAWCVVDGRRLRNFAANDYLNLAHDPRLAAAARRALDDAGTGASASALVTGRTDWHVRLEERLASFERQEAAILFPTGYAANVGTISALAGPGDAIYCDRLNHASLVDGCRLSGARLRVYRHDRIERLEHELKKPSTTGRRWIVTDSIFSMDGDIAPLPDLCNLADRFDAAIILDEAHATGVLGECGRGAAEALGVEDRIAVRIGTLSKAAGSLGGFVAGPSPLIEWLWNRARTQMFSTALPSSACAAALAAFEIIESEPWRRTGLAELSRLFRDRASQAGLSLMPRAEGAILPVVLNDPARAVAAADALEREGFLVAAIRPPTVPKGTSRLRISLSCAHTPADVEALCDALMRVV